MKGTEQFTAVIRAYLRECCMKDKEFLTKCRNPKKSLDECIQYIFSEVIKSGCNGFADEEIFSLAVHYFDEEEITFEKAESVRVLVNHHVELTEEEKEQAKRQAIADYQAKVIADLNKPKTPNKKQETDVLPSLF